MPRATRHLTVFEERERLAEIEATSLRDGIESYWDTILAPAGYNAPVFTGNCVSFLDGSRVRILHTRDEVLPDYRRRSSNA
jgi:hypothetical protein